MINLYLDIDGVLLTKHHKIPVDAGLFLNFALATFDCYWLTTHCKGDAFTALHYLSAHYPPEWTIKLKQIKPTQWDTLKTEGIDFTKPFYWLDDTPFVSEKAILQSNNALDRLILIDLSQDNELQQVLKQLQAISQSK